MSVPTNTAARLQIVPASLFEVVDAITKEIGEAAPSIRISPVTPANDSSDPDAQALFTYVVEGLPSTSCPISTSSRVRPAARATSSRATQPFDYAALRTA